MRLTALLSILVCTLATTLARGATPASNVNLPRPTPEQAAWQDLELGMFYHFDIATFSDGGEGDWSRQGHLDPSLYNPTKLNTDQWLEAAKAMGAGYTVFVAKHCTGFIAWQSDAYPYGVRQSKWRDGKGDVVADYVASCRKYVILPGIYCSMPANAHCDVFGNCTVKGISGPTDPRQIEYRRRAERLVTELWGNYGPLTYIWFDGGTLPPDKGGPDLVPILKRLQPHAVTFQGPPDNPAGNTRWPGNEDGVTGNPSWSTVARANDSGAGNPQGKIWQPGECDAPLRNHDWFWHPNHESKIRTVDELVEMYYGSVGRGCNLILNGNIDRDGLVPEADMKRFKEFGDEIRRRFGKSIAETSGRGNTVELTLTKPTVIDNVILMEQITEGERVRRYVLEGQVGDRWTELAHGQSIGHKRIERFVPIEVTKIRFRATESVAEPVIRKLAVYRAEPVIRPKSATAKPSGLGVWQVLVADSKQVLPAAGKKKAAYPAIGTIERLDPRFDRLVPRDAVLEKLGEGFKWSEGPIWVGQPGKTIHARGVVGGPTRRMGPLVPAASSTTPRVGPRRSRACPTA